MINNSTNFNKTNYHLSPQTIEQKMVLEIQMRVCDRHKDVVRLNWVIGFPPIVNYNTDTNK
jgi:hypothetical protein